MSQISIKNGPSISKDDAEKLAFDVNGYNGVLSEASEISKDTFPVIISYKLYHNSGSAALGLVGSTLLQASSIVELTFLLDDLFNEQELDYNNVHSNIIIQKIL